MNGILDTERYARQLTLLGEAGQARLARERVLVLGAGGLGSPLLLYLAAAGVGALRVADGDTVSPSNLNRQVLYTAGDLGEPKAACAARRLRALNPALETESVTEYLTEENGAALLADCDAVALCVDSREARLLGNRLACAAGLPLVDAGVEGFGGYVTAVLPGVTPCLACWFGTQRVRRGSPQTLGAAAGVLGAMEALALTQLLLGSTELAGQMLFFDGLHWSADAVHAPRREDCPVCGGEKGLAISPRL